jgi:NAD(P)-dependent dehydrogenase (short-subunit alcohol dehydrogenase family)
MAPAHVLVIGGSSGMGLALAERLLLDGAEVTIAGRSTDRLAAAAKGIDQPDRLRTHQVDIGSEAEVAAILAATAPLHHVVVTAADAKDATGPIPGFALDNARAVLDTKLLGPWLVAKHAGAHLVAGGSLTFTSGVSAYRPGPGASITAAANSALEGLVRALALELAPIRVNVVAPGWTDTPLWDTIAGAEKALQLAALAARQPVGRTGRPDDVAQAILALIHNSFITGTVLHVDGGQRLV